MIVLLTQYSQSSGGGGGAGGTMASNGGASGLKPYQTRAGKARALRAVRNDFEYARRDALGPNARTETKWRAREYQRIAFAIRARPVLGGRKPEKYATRFDF